MKHFICIIIFMALTNSVLASSKEDNQISEDLQISEEELHCTKSPDSHYLKSCTLEFIVNAQIESQESHSMYGGCDIDIELKKESQSDFTTLIGDAFIKISLINGKGHSFVNEYFSFYSYSLHYNEDVVSAKISSIKCRVRSIFRDR